MCKLSAKLSSAQQLCCVKALRYQISAVVRLFVAFFVKFLQFLFLFNFVNNGKLFQTATKLLPDLFWDKYFANFGSVSEDKILN